MPFGNYIKERRLELRKDIESGPTFSLRKVAKRIKVEPSYLSKVERELVAPPSEVTIIALAKALDEDPDFLLALANKVPSDVLTIIMKRPEQLCTLLRLLGNVSTKHLENLKSQLIKA